MQQTTHTLLVQWQRVVLGTIVAALLALLPIPVLAGPIPIFIDDGLFIIIPDNKAYEEFTLVDFVGDCNRMQFRIRDASNNHYVLDEQQPCQKINLSPELIGPEVARLLRQRGQLVPLDASGGYQVMTQFGDCNGMTFRVRDNHLGLEYVLNEDAPCETVNFTDPVRVGVNVVHRLLDIGKLVSADQLTVCDAFLGPGDDYVNFLKQAPSLERMYTVCLQPGEYERPILLDQKRNLKLLGSGSIQRPTRLRTNTRIFREGDFPTATLRVSKSSNIILKNLEIINDYAHQLTDNQFSQVSRAVEIYNSSQVILSALRIHSGGKQTVYVANSTLSVIDSELLGAYFLLSVSFSKVYAKNTRFTSHLPTQPGDTHPMLWTWFSRHLYEDTTHHTITGRAILGGVNEFNKDRVAFIGRTTMVDPGKTHSWVFNNVNGGGWDPQTGGMYVHLTDDYPPNPPVRDTWFWQGQAVRTHIQRD